jgi:predicted RNA binding protein YcfA (HicA-like mRNA interferase family)
MTQIAKLYDHVLRNPRSSLSFRDFERLLAAFGFELDRQRGSHRSWQHPAAHRPLVVQPKGKMAKAYQVAEFLDMVEQFRLSMDA